MNAPTNKNDFPPPLPNKVEVPKVVADKIAEVRALARKQGNDKALEQLEMMEGLYSGLGEINPGVFDTDLAHLEEMRRDIVGRDLRAPKGREPKFKATASPAEFMAEKAAPYAGPEISLHQPATGEEIIVPPVGMGANLGVTQDLRDAARNRLRDHVQAVAELIPKKLEKAPVVAAEVHSKDDEGDIHAELDRINAARKITPPVAESAPVDPGDSSRWTGIPTKETPAQASAPEAVAPTPAQEMPTPVPVAEADVDAVVIHEVPPLMDAGTSGEKLRGFLASFGKRSKRPVAPVVPEDPAAITATWAGHGEIPVEQKPVEVPKPIGIQTGDMREQYGPVQKAGDISPAEFRAAQAAPHNNPIGAMPMVPPAAEVVPPPAPVAQPTAEIIQMPKPAAKRVPKVQVGINGESIKNKAPKVVPKPEDAIGAKLDWFKGRNKELDAKAKTLGGKELVQMFRGVGEWYNNQNKWAKIGLGIGVGAGAALSLPFSSVAAGAFGGVIATQRVLGGLGRFVKIEKNLQKVHDGQELKGLIIPNIKVLKDGHEWLAKQPENIRTTASATLAVLYSVAFSAAIGEAVGAVSKEVAPLLAHLWPHAAEHAAAPVVAQEPSATNSFAHATNVVPASMHLDPIPKDPGLGNFKIPPPSDPSFHGGGGSGNPPINLASGVPHDTVAFHPEGNPLADVAPTVPAPAVAEGFSMPVHAGDGAIKGIKHLQEELIAKGYGANSSPALKHLLEGDPTKLAKEYGFYKPGTELESARISSDSSFGIDKEGNIIFTQHPSSAPEVLAKGSPLEVKFDHHAKIAEVKARLGIKVPAATVSPSHELTADDLNRDPAMTHAHQDGPFHPKAAEAPAPATGAPAPLNTSSVGEAPGVASPSSIEHLAERLESVKSSVEARALLDTQIQQSGMTPQLIGEAIKAAPHMKPDLSLMSYVEPNTGAIPGPAVFLGQDGHLTVYGAAAEGNNYDTQIAIAKKFAAASGKPVNVLLPDGAKGHAIVSWNGSVTKETGGFFGGYKPPQSIRDSVYVFPR